MIPSIGLVLSVEMIRDGGSLVVAFQAADGCSYWLLLPVQLDKCSSGEIERVGYGAPLIVDRLVGTTIPLTWQHARVMLAQFAPLIRRERDRRWYAMMTEALLREGTLPEGIRPQFEKSKSSRKPA